MTAAVAASVAQFNQGDTLVNTSGTGADQSKPNTDNTIGGTHIQCNSLLVGFAWLEPYSPSQSVTVRIVRAYLINGHLLRPIRIGGRSSRPKKKPGVFTNAGLRSTRSIRRSGRGCGTRY